MDDFGNDKYSDDEMDSAPEAIAIIGWHGRFPGADDIESFWENIRDGKESIDFYSEDELRQAGVPEFALRDPNFVRAAAKIRDAEMFDADFFAYTPREAILMDPQHRVFLESTWHALENAGIDIRRCAETIGVFAGTNPPSYMHAFINEKEFAQAPAFDIRVSTDSGFFTTRIAYKLNLKGPAITVQTACSTSLVAICLACQHLMNYQCDVALAGAASVQASRKTGYLFQPHGINSPDGHCRAFDENAKGTIGGEGVATVVLKRLDDALADGDTIHAVIKGWALNNDGNAKVGFTAPSVDGQAEVIEMAQALAGVSADSIGYLEAHGTGTELGDPIEVAALSQAFSATTHNTKFCALGSVKANIGHLDAAAGVAGLIKASLVLKNRQIPPLLHFTKPNPKINLEASPFYIVTQLRDWERQTMPRRAGVSSFGLGGTNAHIVLEEGPEPEAAGPSRTQQLLMVSARGESQRDQAMENLANWLEKHPDQALADVAYTLQRGRRQFACSAICVATDHSDAIALLRQPQSASVLKARQLPEPPEVAFMFPGQGNQYLNMGSDLYRSETMFRDTFDACSDLIKIEFGYDLREIVYPSAEGDETAAAETLTRTEYAQPALFVVEYALARLLMSWGIRPLALIGHSIGEYVAATLAGVFTLEDALRLVAHRGRLMQSAPAGSMAAVSLPADKLRDRLPENLSIAVINEPGMCVISGQSAEVDDFVASCQREDLPCHPLHTSHAFHSAMMDEILDEFDELASTVSFSAPEIPFLSNLSGDWITDEQATNPQYWVSHIRQAVMFSDGLEALLQQPARLLYEIGPGNSLSSMAQRHSARAADQHVVTGMRHPRDQRSDTAVLLESLGQAWQTGVEIDWAAFYQNERRRKVPLPGYPFEKKAFWISRTVSHTQEEKPAAETLSKLPNIDDWFYVPSWSRLPATLDVLPPVDRIPGNESFDAGASRSWLVFDDRSELSRQLVDRLKRQGDTVVSVTYGESYGQNSAQSFVVSNVESDYLRLMETLLQEPRPVDGVVYLWASSADSCNAVSEIELSFYSPLFLFKALNRYYEQLPQRSPVDLFFVTEGAQQVIGDEDIHPARSLVLGVSRVGSREMPHLRALCIDLEARGEQPRKQDIEQDVGIVLGEIMQRGCETDANPEVAFRGRYRWVKSIAALPLKPQVGKNDPARHVAGRLKQNGVYLITGGLGGIGRALAEFLADNLQASLVLTGREKLPDPAVWNDWLEQHDAADSVSRKIRFIRGLEAKGARVLSIGCDVSDFDAMRLAVQTASDQFGAIDGVIHAAGLPAGGLIQLKEKQNAAEILAPKVQGALVLDAVFENQKLDFMVFCSSLAAILDNVGQVDYTAANIFLDSLALQRQQKGMYTVSINWDTWAEAGMAVEVELPEQYQESLRKSLDAGIRSKEGVDVFNRILNLNYPQIIVSTRAMAQRLSPLAKHQSVLPVDEPIEPGPGGTMSEKLPYEGATDVSLPEGYISPRNETESILCNIWQDMFGIEHIGIEDNFFELGGHSLLAVQILSRIFESTGVQVSLNEFFDATNISGLAQLIDQHESSRADTGTGETTDEMVDALSDEEVARLLADKGVEFNEHQG